MATLTDLFAVYDIAGTVYFRVDASGNLYGSEGDILGGSGVDFGSTTTEGGNVYLADNKALGLGNDQDLSVTHNATNSVITSKTGDLIVDNTLASGSTILRLGTDTSATDVQIQNNSEVAKLTVKGDGAISTAASTVDLDATGTVQINSSAGAISIGNDANAQAVNIATGNAARAIAIGHAASASLTMEAGVGAWSLTGDTTGALVTGGAMDLDAVGALSLNSSGAAISIGNDSVAQALNLGSAGARAITIGSATAASLAMDGGVGAWSLQGDTTGSVVAGTTLDIDAAGALQINSSAGAIGVGSDNVAQALNLGTAGARAIAIGSATAASLAVDSGVGAWAIQGDTTGSVVAGTSLDVDCAGALQINSSGGAISIGNDAVAQPVAIATGAAARAITIGNAASASLALEAGVGALTANADTSVAVSAGTTVDIDAGAALGIESSGGAITIGGDAVTGDLNLGTGAAARAITIGNAASASLALEAGVGALTANADTSVAFSAGTTVDIDAAGAIGIESSGGAITVGGDAVAQPVSIGTGAAARVITIGNAASASLALEAGVGGATLNADTSIAMDAGTTIDLDAAGAIGIESSAGAISIGADAVAQPVSIASGAAARAITIGNAASASLALEAGVGGVTVDADTSIALQARTTTTDGVAAGIAKVVGGLAYSQTAASAAVTNSAAEVDFDKVIELPAGTLKAGTTVKIRTQGIATATNGTDTLTIKVYLGTATLLTTAAIDVINGDVWFADAEVIVRTTGTGGTLVASVFYQDPDAAGTAPKWAILASTAIDTTAAQAVKASATWSAASTANSCRQDMLSVVVY